MVETGVVAEEWDPQDKIRPRGVGVGPPSGGHPNPWEMGDPSVVRHSYGEIMAESASRVLSPLRHAGKPPYPVPVCVWGGGC